MAAYRRRRAQVDALQYGPDNLAQAVRFVGQDAVLAYAGGRLDISVGEQGAVESATTGDWLIREQGGGLLPPCSDDVFQRLYEPVPTDASA